MQWFPFLGIIYHTEDKIETQITIVPLLLKKNATCKMRL